VRKVLSPDLGFSRQDREANIRRAGLIAREITARGGIAICAFIAPYEESRRSVRELISQCGGYIEVYLSTPLNVCEKRDPNGLYAKARQGLIKHFTGIDDPYEVPTKPELMIDTTNVTPEEAVRIILQYLEQKHHIESHKGT
jgi:sulfate adenylyltransferase